MGQAGPNNLGPNSQNFPGIFLRISYVYTQVNHKWSIVMGLDCVTVLYRTY